MKKQLLPFIIALGWLATIPARAQTWDLITPLNSNLQADSIIAMSSPGGPWLTYVLHPHAISRYNGRWQYFSDTTFGSSARGGYNFEIYFDPNGGLWIGRQRGIYFVSATNLDSPNPKATDLTKTYFPDADIRPPNVHAIYRDRQQALWIGTSNRGLFRFAPNTIFQLHQNVAAAFSSQSPILGGLDISSIVEDRRTGYLLVGTNRGVVLINSNCDSLGTFVADLSDRRIRSLYADRNGWVWAATPVGLYVATMPSLLNFQAVCTPQNSRDTTCTKLNITAVTQDYSGAIWATSNTQVYRYFETADSNPLNWKPDVFPCEASGQFSCVAEWPAEITGTGFNSLSVDRSGFVWVASFTEGILRYNMLWENIKLTDPKIGLQSNIVNTLYWSPIDSGLYVGTRSGAARRDKTGHWQRLPLPANCSDVYSFFHDPAGFLLISVYGCGETRLVKYDGTASTRLSCGGCRILDNQYFAIVKLPDSTLWLAGEKNLLSTRIDSLRQTRIRLTQLTRILGLGSQKFNTFLLQDQYLWIAADSAGLLRYNLPEGRVDIRHRTVGKFASRSVLSLYFEEKTDSLWIGTTRGLTRLGSPYDQPSWVQVSDTRDTVNFVFGTPSGDFWFDAKDGVAHYNREAGITTFPRPAKLSEGGPASKEARAGLRLMEKGQESFWFGTDAGISVFHGDIIPPETHIVPPTSSAPHFKFIEPNIVLQPSSTLFVQYEGGDNLTPSERISFRTKLVREKDDATIQQKSFSPERAESLFFPESGTYRYEVEARDQSGNIDPVPASLIIIADLDAPSVVITQPTLLPNLVSWVPGKLVVKGSVEDADLGLFRVEVTDSVGRLLLPAMQKQRTGPGKLLASVRDSTLAEFDVSNSKFNERRIRIRVTAIDTLSHSRRDSVEARVDAKTPVLTILQPKEAAQVSDSVEIAFKFVERNPVPKLRYFEAADSLQPTEISLRLNRNDSLFSTKAGVGSAAGKHVLTFVLSDSAGNRARQTLVVFRVPDIGISSTSKIWESSDGVVQVHVPPGKIPLTVRISPLVALYADSAKADKLNPQTDAYSIESDPDFDREATLTFFFSDTSENGDQLAIFRQGANNKWRRVGGRLSAENGRSMLRAVIKPGGNYLVAMGATETFQRGNVTCLPRLFSPGRDEPSPFTEVVFTLDQTSPVSIHIFNTAGRRVRSLIQDGEVMPPGRHPVRWNGHDGDGKTLRSGIYIVVVQTASFTETKTVVIQN